MPAFGLRASYDGATLGYSGDAGPCKGLDAVAHGVDLFCCEAGTGAAVSNGPQWHCRPEDAGEAAARSQAARLVLTHVDTHLTSDQATTRAGREFGSAIEFLHDGDIVNIG